MGILRLIILGSKREAKGRIRNILFWAATSCLCAFAFAGETAEVPPIPPGYANELAIKAAILLGQIRLIDAKTAMVAVK